MANRVVEHTSDGKRRVIKPKSKRQQPTIDMEPTTTEAEIVEAPATPYHPRLNTNKAMELVKKHGLKTVVLLMAALGTANSIKGFFPNRTEGVATTSDSCETIINEGATINRDELLQFYTLDRSKEITKQEVLDMLGGDQGVTCSLSTIEVREGVSAERLAVTIEFDPKTSVVLLFENDILRGHDFTIKQ